MIGKRRDNFLDHVINYEKFSYKNETIDPTVTTFHFLFEKQVEATPEKCAVICDNTFISYETLNNEANQLAHLLISKGLKKEMIVGIYLNRSIKTLISLLAILKAGGAFLLIDKSLPLDRINFIIDDSHLGFLLIEENNLICQATNINIEDYYSYPKNNPNLFVAGDNMAYVIYTSGTTGKPKGVVIEHRSIVNTLLNQIEKLFLTQADRVLCAAPLSFDAFIWEVGALLAGAEIFLTTKKERENLRSLGHLIQHHRITIATLTPSVLRIIPDRFLSQLRVLISAGEACTPDLLKKISNDCYFYNAYGPTETAICATMSHCKRGDERITLGMPLKNIFIYALKEDLKKAEAGEFGTLYIGGLGLARGYLNHPELTAKFFIDYPDKLYNTGDLVRVNNDGSFEYIGRKDEEIKIYGNRVNLNEIQCLLLQHPNIANSLVTVDRNHKKFKNKIVAIIATDDELLELKDIKNYLHKFLPSYMLPSKLIKTKKIPLSFNNKIIKK